MGFLAHKVFKLNSSKGQKMGMGRKRSVLKMKRRKSQAAKKARIQAKIQAKKSN